MKYTQTCFLVTLVLIANVLAVANDTAIDGASLVPDRCHTIGINVDLTNWTTGTPKITMGQQLSTQLIVDPDCQADFHFPVWYYFFDGDATRLTAKIDSAELKDVVPSDVIKKAGTYRLCAAGAYPNPVIGCSQTIEVTEHLSILEIVFWVLIVISVGVAIVCSVVPATFGLILGVIGFSVVIVLLAVILLSNRSNRFRVLDDKGDPAYRNTAAPAVRDAPGPYAEVDFENDSTMREFA